MAGATGKSGDSAFSPNTTMGGASAASTSGPSIKTGADPTYDGVGQGTGLSDPDIKKARSGGTIKMGPGGAYVE